jgi:predicted alpha/beta superfamily hydrolase
MARERPSLIRLVLGLALVLIFGVACAVAAVVLTIIPHGRIVVPPRAGNGTAYVLYVDTPAACTKDRPCPALYLLDGERWFNSFKAIAHKAAAAGQAQPIVLVGIGYVDVVHTTSRRWFDFSPPSADPGAVPPFLKAMAARSRPGGAEAYLAVLKDEIVPFAEKEFPIAPEGRGIAGHSFGGLFAAYALAHAPGLFERVLMASPSLWFGGDETFEPPADAGPHVVEIAADARPGAGEALAGAPADLARKLSALSGFEVHGRAFPGTVHDTVFPPAFRAALPQLYPPATQAP